MTQGTRLRVAINPMRGWQANRRRTCAWPVVLGLYPKMKNHPLGGWIFIVKGLLQTTSDGTTKLMDFLDEQRMCRLYEKFILEYYKKEFPKLKVTASQIPWDLDDDESDMLPVMQSDIMLSDKDKTKTLIMDAKYYSRTMQVQYDVHTLHSSNLYQIYTYVKNFDKTRTGNVSGMLLYARTDEVKLPHNSYKMGGNKISVDTLNLDCEFEEIKKQLNGIAIEHFGLEIA